MAPDRSRTTGPNRITTAARGPFDPTPRDQISCCSEISLETMRLPGPRFPFPGRCRCSSAERVTDMRMCITVRLTRWQAAFIAMAAPLHRSPDRPGDDRQRPFVAIPGPRSPGHVGGRG